MLTMDFLQSKENEGTNRRISTGASVQQTRKKVNDEFRK